MNPVEAEPPDTDEGQDTATDVAYHRSSLHEWRGRELEPFSFVRRTAAIALGLRCWKLTPADFETLENPRATKRKKLEAELESLNDRFPNPTKKEKAKSKQLESAIADLADQPESIEVYSDMAYDAAIVLWLCSQPDRKCQKVRRKPRDFETEIDRWAEKNGIFEGSFAQLSGEALTVFFEIVNDINTSEGTPDIKGQNTSPDPN